MAQPVPRGAALTQRDAELLQHVVEAAQVAFEVAVGRAHVGVSAGDHLLRQFERRLLNRRGQRHPAHPAALALDPQILIRLLLLHRQPGFGERLDMLERSALHGFLAAQPEGLNQPQRRADEGVVGEDLSQHVVGGDALGRPALVAPGVLVALVLLQAQSIVRGPAHETGLAHPHRQPPQEAQVGLDGGRRQALVMPHLNHRMDVLLPEVARVGRHLEPGLQTQVPEEAAQELRPLLACLVRYRFLQ